MKKVSVFVKLGGSYITDKDKQETLIDERVTTAARMMKEALVRAAKRDEQISLVLGHGAGSFGHIHAERYGAVEGVHPELGWEGLYKIRDAMTRMNLKFVRHCGEAGLFPVTVSPFAVATAKNGEVVRLDVHNLLELLGQGQIPLLHGDVVPDSKRGFTIASTESLLTGLIENHIRFNRVVMVADTEGVLDKDGATVEEITPFNIGEVSKFLGGSGSPDVTGGMQRKIETLFSLVVLGKVGEARIIRAVDRPENLIDAILGTGGGGTHISASV
ncbi:isopentenyl phosphate kinase [Elusimicrobiota bacterium]